MSNTLRPTPKKPLAYTLSGAFLFFSDFFLDSNSPYNNILLNFLNVRKSDKR